MKKIFLIGLISLIFISIASAHPFIPETDGIKSDFYRYISDDCLTEYKACIPVYDDKYHFYLQSISLVTGVSIAINITFPNKEKLDEYIDGFNVEDMDVNFHAIRKSIIKAGIKPIYVGDKNKVERVIYIIEKI